MGEMQKVIDEKLEEFITLPKNDLVFRKLRAEEIDCRVATVSEKGCSLLLYKDARCDQNILDETVGALNWERKHSRENANCTVSIYDWHKDMWVSKEDTGTESYTEKEKGLASDSFKRACFNWGIGRELYTAPFIWIKAGDVNLTQKNGKFTTYDRFYVKSIGYDENGNINQLSITDKNGEVVYSFGKKAAKKEEPKEVPEKAMQEAPDVSEEIITEKEAKILESMITAPKMKASVLKRYGIESFAQMTKAQYAETVEAKRKFDEQNKKTEELKEKVDGNQSENQ